jgi:predicted O-methyltransferase YrrM
MARKLPLSPRILSDVFWEAILAADDERGPEREALAERLKSLEDLRAAADYDTGSTSLPAAWCLYNLVRYFRCARVIEVGTFIGRSAVAMAAAMDAQNIRGEIFTCDDSNSIAVPWTGGSRLHQFPKSSSTEMLKALDGLFDFVFLDGRLRVEDLPLVDGLVSQDTIFALDDFEGVEKGVANLSHLSRLHKLKDHFLIYPASGPLLARHGLTNYSLVAALVPVSIFEFARQG